MTARRRLAAPIWIIAAALPLRIALAIATDLSPDEAYYLCAARASQTSALVDHPPLLPLMLRVSDRLLPWLPVELRVRGWPLVLGTLVAAALVLLVARRTPTEPGRAHVAAAHSAWATTLAATVGAWGLLPMSGGFVATPDGPALLAIAVLLLWASPGKPTIGWALAAGGIGALGCLAKVIVLPAALAVAALAHRRSLGQRLAVAVPAVATLPWLWPSLRFQARHAFGPGAAPWQLHEALGALAVAALAQGLLWPPWLLVAGRPRLGDRRDELAGGAIVLGLGAALVVSALARALPPEANWFAPAALVVVARGCTRLPERASRWAAAFAAVPTIVAAIHVVRPFLPIPITSDPTARLHGWSRMGASNPAASAPGTGAYGAAAELCIYRNDCNDIDRFFSSVRVQ